MSFWMRAGTIQIGAFKYKLSDLVFEFSVPFEDSEQLIVADITIYNLSKTTRGSIKKNDPVILNVGYEGDIGVIFVGKVSQCSSSHKGLEWITKIKATEAMDEWLSKKVNKTYKAQIDAMSIIKDLLNIFGMEVSNVELAQNKKYSRGKVCNGPIRDVLKNIVTSDCKSVFLIRHNKIIIRNPNKGTNLGVLLTPATGLLLTNNEDVDKTDIVAAQDTQKTAKERSESSKRFKRECLLNYRLAPGDIVKIKDSQLNGNFMIKKGVHAGSRRTDWKTILEVVAL